MSSSSLHYSSIKVCSIFRPSMLGNRNSFCFNTFNWLTIKTDLERFCNIKSATGKPNARLRVSCSWNTLPVVERYMLLSSVVFRCDCRFYQFQYRHQAFVLAKRQFITTTNKFKNIKVNALVLSLNKRLFQFYIIQYWCMSARTTFLLCIKYLSISA